MPGHRLCDGQDDCPYREDEDCRKYLFTFGNDVMESFSCLNGLSCCLSDVYCKDNKNGVLSLVGHNLCT